MTSHRAAMALLLTLAACAKDDKPKPGALPSKLPGGSVLTLTPGQGHLLTCTGEVMASQPSAWSTEPFNQGTFELNGPWHAPTSTSQGGQVLFVKATANVNTKLIASGQYLVATAFPGAPISVNGSTADNEGYGVFQHAIATKAARSYAVWPAQDGTTVKLMLGRSDDSGATWNVPATALSSVVKDSKSKIDCAAVTVDAANPDIVHAISRISGANDLADGLTLALATSKDGGATFTSHVLQNGAGVGDKCPDLISPAADAVIIASSNGQTEYVTSGNVPGAKSTFSAAPLAESPVLFTDGKGRMCVTYSAAVQCSNDKGATWSAPLQLGPSAGVSWTVGAISADGHAGVVWSAGDALIFAASTDSAATFAAPAAISTFTVGDAGHTPASNPVVGYDDTGILWLAYESSQHVILDKTCDHGKTWSGATYGPEARWPALAMTPGDAPHLLAVADGNHLAIYPLAP